MVRAWLVVAAQAITVLASIASAGPAPVGTITCNGSDAVAGGTATIQVALQRQGEALVAGVQNDIDYDDDLFFIEPEDCVINPAIGPGSEPGKELSTSVLTDFSRLRNIVVSLDNVNDIPSGLLYTCTFDVADDAPLGNYQFVNSRIIASDPDGTRIPADGTDCTITVTTPTPSPTPIGHCEDDDDCPPGQVCVDNHCVTPTPSPTPIGFCDDNDDCPEGQVCIDNRCVTVTPTPIGFCTDNDDCPPGQVCVDNRCVTPTPTRTPIGFCTDNDDCPVGQVCVNNMCVTVTPTRRSGDGGGCSCEIDPRERPPLIADGLTALLPALMLLLLRRRAPTARRGNAE
jgi:hypothetical protein